MFRDSISEATPRCPYIENTRFVVFRTASARSTSQQSTKPTLPGTVRNKIILVADDNPVMRDALCKLFEFEDGLELCEHAVNGQDAIEKAKKFRPDLIILDFSMPVMNGLAAARILKTIMPAVPIILFTIHSKEMLLKEAQDTGIDAIVSKAEMLNLVKRMRTLLKAA